MSREGFMGAIGHLPLLAKPAYQPRLRVPRSGQIENGLHPEGCLVLGKRLADAQWLTLPVPSHELV